MIYIIVKWATLHTEYMACYFKYTWVQMLLYIYSSKIIKAGLVIEYFYAVQLLLLLK